MAKSRTEIRDYKSGDTVAFRLLKNIRENQQCVLLTQRLSNREYQQIQTQPIWQARCDILYFNLIGGDNSFTECVDVSIEGNVVPIFCMPPHKNNFILSLVRECKVMGLHLLSEHVYASLNVSHIRGLSKEETYISDTTKSFLDLQQVSIEWHKYCEYLKEHKNAYKTLPKYLAKMLTPVALPEKV